MTWNGSGLSFELNASIDKIAAMLAGKSDTPMQAAQKIAETAKAMAPIDSGEYESSIHAEKTARGAVVVSHSEHAHWVEFGAPARGIEARWIMHKAALISGYEFGKASK